MAQSWLRYRRVHPLLLLALLALFGAGCGHSPRTSSRKAVQSKQVRALLPGAIAFWDNRYGLALFGAPPATSGPTSDTLKATSDGGRNWRRLRSAPSGTRIVVAGDSRAWLLTGHGLLRSDDRGATWMRISRYPLFDVSFDTARHGIGYGVARGHELLAATDDGGQTWHRLRFPCRDDGDTDGDDRVSLAAPNVVSVLCVSEPGVGQQWKRLYRSSDDGRTWVRRTATGVGYLMGFAFGDSRRGWLWERRGWFLRTDDGGRTWFALALGKPEKVEAESASFSTRRQGLALLHVVGRGPRGLKLVLVRTADGGKSWVRVRSWPVLTWPGV